MSNRSQIEGAIEVIQINNIQQTYDKKGSSDSIHVNNVHPRHKLHYDMQMQYCPGERTPERHHFVWKQFKRGLIYSGM